MKTHQNSIAFITSHGSMIFCEQVTNKCKLDQNLTEVFAEDAENAHCPFLSGT